MLLKHFHCACFSRLIELLHNEYRESGQVLGKLFVKNRIFFYNLQNI